MSAEEAVELLRQMEDVEIAQENLIRQYREALQAINKVLADAILSSHSRICDDTDCPYMRRWREPHPYGEGVAYESLSECTCQNGLECPYYQGIA